MSAGLNTVAGTIYEDFIEPLAEKKTRETRAALIMKTIVIVFGIICLLLITVIDKMGSLIEVRYLVIIWLLTLGIAIN